MNFRAYSSVANKGPTTFKSMLSDLTGTRIPYLTIHPGRTQSPA